MTTDDFCFYFQNRLIQTSQTGGRRYSGTSPFSIPWSNLNSVTRLGEILPLGYFSQLLPVSTHGLLKVFQNVLDVDVLGFQIKLRRYYLSYFFGKFGKILFKFLVTLNLKQHFYWWPWHY
jgi:hypothetical protein